MAEFDPGNPAQTWGCKGGRGDRADGRAFMTDKDTNSSGMNPLGRRDRDEVKRERQTIFS